MPRWLVFSAIGCGGLVLLFVLVIACSVIVGTASKDSGSSSSSSDSSSGDSSSSSSSGEKTVSIGESVAAGDVSWTVTNARQANQLKASFGNPKQGNFVVVDFTFANNGNKAVTLDTNSLTLLDSDNRESKADPDTFQYVDPNKQIFLEQVNPGVSKQGEAIFTVADGAHGFRLQAGDTDPFSSENAYVDLGF